MSVKAEDAVLLTQGKNDNAGRRKIDRKDEQGFKLSDYTGPFLCTVRQMRKIGKDMPTRTLFSKRHFAVQWEQ